MPDKKNNCPRGER